MRPLGVLLPEGTPELPEDSQEPRTELAKWIVQFRQSPDRSGHGEPHLGVSFRPRNRGDAERFRPHGRAPDRIRSCWIIWRNEFVSSGWSIKHVHRLILLSSTYQQAFVKITSRSA